MQIAYEEGGNEESNKSFNFFKDSDTSQLGGEDKEDSLTYFTKRLENDRPEEDVYRKKKGNQSELKPIKLDSKRFWFFRNNPLRHPQT